MIKKWVIIGCLLLVISTINSPYILADDDDEYEHDNKEKKERNYKKEHDDDDYEKRGYQAPIPTITPWNIWTRDTQLIPASLPFTTTKRVTLRDEQSKTHQLTIVVKEQELFVDVYTMANLLEANAVIYPKSQLAEVKNDQVTLLFKSQTNVVYENLQKQPLPATTFMNGYKMYVPLRVITNALGYVFEWDQANQQFYYYVL